MKTQKYSTLIEALREAPPNKPFVTLWHDDNDIETVTFGDFIRLAEAKALQLIRLGIGKGDIVILIQPQDINVMAAFAGTMMIGAIPSILAYPNFKVEPSKYKRGLMGVCSNLGARLILVDDKFPSDLIDLIEKSQETRVRIIRDSTGSVEKPERLSLQDIDSEKIAFIQHSAGTTGLQKGVSLSHSAVLRQIEHLVDVLTINERDKLYNWLPLYHDMGLIACFMLPMAVHLSVIMQPPVEWVMRPSTMMRLISVFECTMAWVPNFALQFIARRTPDEEKNDLNLSSLRALINCSEPVRAKSLDEFYSVFKNRGLHKNSLKTSYAMAENVFAVTQSESSSEPSRLWANETVYRDEHRVVPVSSDGDRSVCFVSSGSCLPENEVRILDKNGTDLTDGYIGEIAIASDSLFTGYFNRPDLTNEVLSKGWYLTGDLGFKMDGELYVTGRKKDLIIVAGKNIYPQDIEEVVSSLPMIHDGRAVAFGLFNNDLGTEEIHVVAEVEEIKFIERKMEIELLAKSAIVAEFDVTIKNLFLREPQWIVKSTAGKPARSATREKLLKEHPELTR